jgi:hypothetical protein
MGNTPQRYLLVAYDAILEDSIDLEAIRARYHAMTDAELLENGKPAAYMASPQASYGPARPIWHVYLAEARAEWRRRVYTSTLPERPANPPCARACAAPLRVLPPRLVGARPRAEWEVRAAA